MTTISPNMLAQAADAAAAGIAIGSNTGTAAAASTAIGNTALQQLGSNFNDFLNLLLTQLQNQDPSQPLDTNQFTTELVQFTGVQQQVATNSSLSQLIALQQTNQTLQASQLVGHTATVTANQITLQNGQGEVQFNATAGQPVAIGIVGPNGAPLRTVLLTAQQGSNTWNWDGTTDQGQKLPDGAYRISVQTGTTNGAATPLPFSVIGTATAIASSGGTTTLDLGGLAVPLSAVQDLSGT